MNTPATENTQHYNKIRVCRYRADSEVEKFKDDDEETDEGLLSIEISVTACTFFW